MRVPGVFVDIDEFLTRIGTHGLLVRGALVLTVTISAVTASALGHVDAWFLVGLVLLGCLAAVSPDSVAPLAVIAAMCVQWVVLVRPMSVTWSLVPAVCVLVVHVTAARASSLADHAPVHGILVRRWLRQMAAVGVAAVAVWILVVVLSATTIPAGVGVTALAFVVAGATMVAMTLRLDGSSPRDDLR
ncbi:MAG: hypothetical protein WBV37_16790 [Nocardioidaceae bacterium]